MNGAAAKEQGLAKEWQAIFIKADVALRKPENWQGIKVDTPLGLMNVRRTGARFCAWINHKGLSFGSTPKTAVANLAMMLIERTPLVSDRMQ